MMKVKIIRTFRPNVGPKKVTEHVIEAETADEVWALCFRQHFNKYKYANSTSARFADPANLEPYRKWVNDVRNYANNGGDMW